jgi:hypothetical protein
VGVAKTSSGVVAVRGSERSRAIRAVGTIRVIRG